MHGIGIFRRSLIKSRLCAVVLLLCAGISTGYVPDVIVGIGKQVIDRSRLGRIDEDVIVWDFIVNVKVYMRHRICLDIALAVRIKRSVLLPKRHIVGAGGIRVLVSGRRGRVESGCIAVVGLDLIAAESALGVDGKFYN